MRILGGQPTKRPSGWLCKAFASDWTPSTRQGAVSGIAVLPMKRLLRSNVNRTNSLMAFGISYGKLSPKMAWSTSIPTSGST